MPIAQIAPIAATAKIVVTCPDARLRPVQRLYHSGRFRLLKSRLMPLLKQYPGDVALWLLAGAAEVGLEDFPSAQQCFEVVLNGDPENVEALFNLASLARRQGDAGRSISLCTEVLKRAPKMADAWQALGQGLRQVGRSDDAVAALAEALRLRPDQPDLAGQLGTAFYESERFEEALSAFGLAVDLGADEEAIFLGQGRVLHRLGRLKEALSAVDFALQRTPLDAMCRDLRAQCLRALGRRTEAEHAMLGLLADTPDYARGYMNFAHSFQLSEARELLATVEDRLASPVSEGDEVFLRFALARARHEQKNYVDAYRQLCRGNALRRTRSGYDIRRDEALFATLKQVFDTVPSMGPATVPDKRPDTVHAGPKMAHGDVEIGPCPIFITGLPRSGTSLVETILSRHQQVTPMGELNHLARSVDATGGVTGPLNSGRLEALARQYHARLGAPDGPSYVTDKMPLNFRLIGFIAEAMPDAKILHVHRDPRATCWSMFRTYLGGEANGFSCDPEDICSYYSLYHDLMAFWDLRYPGRIIHLDYEALVVDPETRVPVMISALGLDWQQDCLLPHLSDYQPSTASSDQVQRPIYTESRNGWQAYASLAGKWLSRLPEAQPEW